jgi:hypothetical protein
MTKRLFIFICICMLSWQATAQQDSSATRYKKRQQWVRAGLYTSYGGTMVMLYNFWYKDYPMEGFHFFNDNKEWMQMDKVGHAFSAYQVGLLGMELYRWSGKSNKKTVWVGGALGSVFLTSIEILDGFSSEWGASWGDLLANTSGTALVISQELLWQEQRVRLKYSFSQSGLAPLRPNTLGSTLAEECFKDYNGQTYWLSANLKSIAFPEQDKFPAWLNVAVGYGANGMTGGYSNVFESDGVVYDYTNFTRYRQWYISPDIDWSKIKTKSAFLKKLFFVLNATKIPAPAIQFNKKGVQFHYLHF